MTRWLFAACCLGLLAVACGGTAAEMRAGSFDTQELPAELRQPYAIFEVRCSKCHTLDRPLNAHIVDKAHWDRYVARMRRMPGSGISPRDANEILKFLYYLADLKRQESGLGQQEELLVPMDEEPMGTDVPMETLPEPEETQPQEVYPPDDQLAPMDAGVPPPPAGGDRVGDAGGTTLDAGVRSPMGDGL